jgi:4-hydroxy-4-methyl-2-oxoglutarate aldolase
MALDPILTLRAEFARPTPAQLAAFASVPTNWVCDLLGRRGALDYRIKAVTRAQRFVGAALTVWSRPRDNLATFAAIRVAKPGDVLMVSVDDCIDGAVCGDYVLGLAKNKGIAAYVTDGVVRDVAGLDQVGIPCFARGLIPASGFADGPGEIGGTISLGGQSVSAGDLVVGDPDGVAVISRARIDEVIAGLDGVRAKEAQMEAAIKSGATEPPWLAQKIDGRVRMA